MSEEEFKHRWRNNHPELDKLLTIKGKYDLISENFELGIEAKEDESDWKKIITQQLLTGAKYDRVCRYSGAISKNVECCIDTVESKIPAASTIKKYGAKPSAWNSQEWKQAHKDLSKLYIQRKMVTSEEIIIAAKAYQFQQGRSKKDKSLDNIGFIFGIKKQTLWAKDDEKIVKQNSAYFTPPEIRKKVFDIVNKNWPNLKTIWDPCAGDGELVTQFIDKEVICSDIDPKNSLVRQLNFLYQIPEDITKKFGEDFAIITNPPFNKKFETYLINFALKNKIKLLTFGMGYSFPFVNLPAVDSFLTMKKEWKNLSYFSYLRNVFIISILFDPNKPNVDQINGFEFITNDMMMFGKHYFRCGSPAINLCKQMGQDLFRRSSWIPKEYCGKIITKERYDWIIKNVDEAYYRTSTWSKK